MIGASTEFASIGIALGVGEAVLDTLLDDLCHQWMQCKRCRHEVANVRMLLGRGGSEAGDVLVPVAAGEQEVREDDDRCGAAVDAPCERGFDGGLRELHVGRLDDFVAGGRLEVADDVEQHGVAFGAAGAVVDEDDGELGWGGGHVDTGRFSQSLIAPGSAEGCSVSTMRCEVTPNTPRRSREADWTYRILYVGN